MRISDWSSDVCSSDLQGRVVVLGDDQRRHQITLASLRSLSTSSATEATFTPALRAGGSFTATLVSRGVTPTPRSSGVRVSIGFFLHFMMLGRETSRGWFGSRSDRKSVV